MSFANSSNFTIQGSTFTDVNGNLINYASQPGERGIRELFKYSYPEAAYDSQYRHPDARGSSGARELAVKDVFGWINSGRTNICWIYGAPGSGKTQIVLDVAAQCAYEKILGASFFFNRNFRASSERLVSSIAFQLAVSSAEKRLQVGEVIEDDPSILQKPLAIQMRKLVIPSFPSQTPVDGETQHSRPTGPPVVILIDAIDECFDKGHQHEIIHFVQEASSYKHLPILWIIASRPETNIRHHFDALATQVHSISIADIDRFLERWRPLSMFAYLRNRLNESYERQPNLTAFLQFILMALLDFCYKIFWKIVMLVALVVTLTVLVPGLIRLAFGDGPRRHRSGPGAGTNNTSTAIPNKFNPRI